MHDWMTITLELIGIAIFFIWAVLPVREFRDIFHRIHLERERDARSGRARGNDQPADSNPDA